MSEEIENETYLWAGTTCNICKTDKWEIAVRAGPDTKDEMITYYCGKCWNSGPERAKAEGIEPKQLILTSDDGWQWDNPEEEMTDEQKKMMSDLISGKQDQEP